MSCNLWEDCASCTIGGDCCCDAWEPTIENGGLSISNDFDYLPYEEDSETTEYPSKRFCVNCGRRVGESWNYCLSCGSEIPDEIDDTAFAAYDSPFADSDTFDDIDIPF